MIEKLIQSKFENAFVGCIFQNNTLDRNTDDKKKTDVYRYMMTNPGSGFENRKKKKKSSSSKKKKKKQSSSDQMRYVLVRSLFPSKVCSMTTQEEVFQAPAWQDRLVLLLLLCVRALRLHRGLHAGPGE